MRARAAGSTREKIVTYVNIQVVVQHLEASASNRTRPLVAVGYGPRCVPVMQLVQAATGLCDLLWMVDASLPEMSEMIDLLSRFGPVVNVSGLDVDQLREALADYRPDALTTYLDAGMVRYAAVAASMELPFHSVEVASALVDKFRQREVLGAAGLAMPTCRPIGSELAVDELAESLATARWPAFLTPREVKAAASPSRPPMRRSCDELLAALEPVRPEMVLEAYLADDPLRAGSPYAGYVSVESIVADGAISHLALTGRFPLAENFRETGFFIPAALEPADQQTVLSLATDAISALGVRQGCLHTEIKFTPEGPRIIEVNGRVGGGVPEMLERAAGLPLIELTLRVALGEQLRIEGPVPTERIGYRFFLQPPAQSATVAAVDGINVVSDYPGVDSISLHQGPGSALDWRDGSRTHIIAVVGSASDHEELQAVNRLLHKEVTVTYVDVRH